ADVMPPSNWAYLLMGISVLFNVMGLANRFVLWRIDAARVRAEHDIGLCFGPDKTPGDIARMEPSGAIRRDDVDRLIERLTVLAARSRRLSLSILVPMGGEMAYRYQESLIHEAVSALRSFRERWDTSRGGDASS